MDSGATASNFSLSSFYPFPDAEQCTFAQIIFLTGVYGYFLFLASNLISDGSELLLLVPKFAPIVGSVVLPVLGAVPDGVMVLFSGLGKNAQHTVSVGVGALAGSTIMLLTLPWFLVVLAGRVSIRNGVPTYKRPPGADQTWEKLDPPGNFSLTGTGVGLGSMLHTNARIMLLTMLGYAIIQGSSFAGCNFQPWDEAGLSRGERKEDLQSQAHGDRYFALVALLVCSVQFAWYLHLQWIECNSIDDMVADVSAKALLDGTLTLRGVMAACRESGWRRLGRGSTNSLDEVLLNNESMNEVRKMCKVLAPFFYHYDQNGDQQIDFEEFRMIFKDVNENISREHQMRLFDAADTDGSGNISFEEFLACFMSYALDPANDLKESEKHKYIASPNLQIEGEEEHEEEEEGDVVEDMPEDLAELDPQEQQWRLKKRSLKLMGLGTAMVLFFSDPMVDLLAEIGKRLDVSPFYISFFLAPLASNASELVASYNYAKKRTLKSMTTALSTLEGAAVMNNTFCLGICLALVYFKGLAWRFTAETISIVVIEVLVALTVIGRKTQRLLDGILILAFYPLSLCIVWVLENKVGLD